jgi:hypothetical protein
MEVQSNVNRHNIILNKIKFYTGVGQSLSGQQKQTF